MMFKVHKYYLMLKFEHVHHIEIKHQINITLIKYIPN